MSELSFSLADFIPVYSGINTESTDPVYSYYPNLGSLNPDKKEFYPATVLKKEFNELRLLDTSQTAPGKFQPLPHQVFLSRFMSQYTPYDRMLVFHEVGTGKSWIPALVSELAFVQNPGIRETLLLVRNEILERTLLRDIATRGTNNKYISPTHDAKGNRLTARQREMRMMAALEKNYASFTFRKFATLLASYNDSENPQNTLEKDRFIQETFNNRIIIIDEAHNLRVQDKDQKVSTYNEIFHFLHTVQGCKILLMTATPMRDHPDEIADLLNLLLPLNNQFDTKNFISTYFRSETVLKEDMRDQFKDKIRGIVSYVRALSSNVVRLPNGEILPDMHSRLVTVKMQSNQAKKYLQAYSLDKKSAGNKKIEDMKESEDEEGKSAFYVHSRQAISFVAPDGSTGTDIVSNGWLIPPKRLDIEKGGKSKKISTSENPSGEIDKSSIILSLKPKKLTIGQTQNLLLQQPVHEKIAHASEKLRDYIGKGSLEEKLKRLETLSPKFAGVIKEIVSPSNSLEKVFVYSNLVTGAGANLFAALLELFDFSHVTLPGGDESYDNPATLKKFQRPNQFLLIVGGFPSGKQAADLIRYVWNNPDNLYGKYIRVIIASKLIGEGASFKGVRQFHLLTPGWNETEMNQAQGRVIRTDSHDDFPLQERYIKLFRWCCLPPTPESVSIDILMYQKSEKKDVPIKLIERLLQEAAVDCALNTKRNMRPDIYQDGSPECNYGPCTYPCLDIPRQWYSPALNFPENKIISDSYNLFYADEDVKNIKEQIVNLFQLRFSYTIKELLEKIHFTSKTTISPLIIIRSLKDLIDRAIPIRNRYGIVSYLKEDNNLFFLVDSQDISQIKNLFLLTHYNQNPVISESMSFNDFVNINEYQIMPERIDIFSKINIDELLSKPKGRDSFVSIVRDFDISIQESLLESFIIAEERKIPTREKLRKAYLDIFSGEITRPRPGMVISTLLSNEDKGPTRCFDISTMTWSDCKEDISTEVQAIREEKKQTLKENPYGFYGIYDSKAKEKDRFRIYTLRKVRMTKDGKEDKRMQREGQVCKTGRDFVKEYMVYILLQVGEITEKTGQSPPTLKDIIDPDIWNASKHVDAKTVMNRLENFLKSMKQRLGEITPKKPKKESKAEKESSIAVSVRFAQEANVPVVINMSLEDIQKFSQEKLQRWNILLSPEINAGQLCQALYKWFEQVGILYKE